MMSEHGGKTSRLWEPQRSQQAAQSPASTLPEGALVFFRLDVVAKWAGSRFDAPSEKETRGAPPCAPAMLVCLLLSAYSVGVLASRNIAWACERHLAFRAIGGEDRPDFRTISACRTWHLAACKEVLVQVGRFAGAAGVVTVGHVATDGTNIQGHASRHQAMRSGYRKQAVARLRADIAAWVTRADQQEETDDAA